jgi:hypothetical protein
VTKPSTHTAQHHMQHNLIERNRWEYRHLHSICSPPLSSAVV